MVPFEDVCYSLNLGYKLVRSISNKTYNRTNFFCFVYVRLIIEGCKVVDLTEKVTTLKQRIDDMENEQNVTN